MPQSVNFTYLQSNQNKERRVFGSWNTKLCVGKDWTEVKHASGQSLSLWCGGKNVALEGGLLVTRLMESLLRRGTECGS